MTDMLQAALNGASPGQRIDFAQAARVRSLPRKNLLIFVRRTMFRKA
jgi:hypothetical protein